MKKIFIILLAGTALFLSSCNKDREYIYDKEGVIDATAENVNVTLSAPAGMGQKGNILKFTATFSKSFTTDAKFRILVNGGNFVEDFKDYVLEAGQTSITADYLVPNDGYTNFEPPFVFNMKAVGLVMLEGTPGTKYNAVSNTVTFKAYDKLPIPTTTQTGSIAVDNGTIKILFDWMYPADNDLDIALIDPSGILAAYSLTGARYEQVQILSTKPDGEYKLLMGVYTSDSPINVGFKYFVNSKPNFTTMQLKEGVYADLTTMAGYTLDIDYSDIFGEPMYEVLKVTKTTNSGVVSFTVATLP